MGLGSNMGYSALKSIQILQGACELLSNALCDFVHSSVYKTKALYFESQDDFFNMVVRGKVPDTCSALELLFLTQSIESIFGRNRSREIRFGPRPLDIDIELFGNLHIREKNLIIPHERITERAFVLVPLLEILENSADDVHIREEYKKHADSLSYGKIELFMSACDF